MLPSPERVSRRRRGALEQQVLTCLALADGPLTAGEVQGALGTDLAYTTILTTLSRLHAKHALVRKLDGRAYRYALAGDRAAAAANVTAHRMLGLLEGSDRAQVLSRFIADLAPGDGELLTQLLSDSTSGERPSGVGDT